MSRRGVSFGSRALLVAGLLGAASCVGASGRGAPARGAATPDRHIVILCYHDVSENAQAPLQSVSPAFLRQQIRACRARGWTFVPLSTVLRDRDHPELLPPRTMVLTFDDAYRSFLERALPVLHDEHVPATLAVITSFVDQPPADLPPLMTWEELREVARDSLVEIQSHTHALHRYEAMNPYRDTAPSAATRRYLLAEARYENREEYRARIRSDLDTTRRVLRERLDIDATVLVWPYGMHNEMARGLAQGAGFRASLALGGREVSREELRLGCLPRIMVTRRMRFDGDEAAWRAPTPPAIRAADIDLDDVYSRDPIVLRDRIERLVRRVRALGATHAFVSVCSDTAGDGRLGASWCMNHQVFTRADIWSMVAAKLAQARIKVWARVPALNLTWSWRQHPEWRMGADARDARHGGPTGVRGLAATWPTRLSPNLPEVQRAAIDFLSDIAVYAPIDGIVFDTDAAMAANEHLALTGDASPRVKAAAIDDLIDRCRDAVRAWRPECRFARAVEPEAIEASGAAIESAQDVERIASQNDLIVVAPHTSPGGHPNAARGIERLARRGAGRTNGGPGRARILIDLQALDRASGRWIPARSLAELLAAARRGGVASIGIGPVTPSAGDLPEALLDSVAPPELMTGDPAYL